jgi:phosphoglycolate phosphatase-like HAD superfamily hydrolase
MTQPQSSNYPIIIHGSENSLDIDAYVVVPEPMDFKPAKQLCDSYKEINANLIAIKDGIVAWSYKGTKDECNNSILATYHLHEQTAENPVEHAVTRAYGQKMLRTVRGLISYCSRTQHRAEVKKALVSDSMDYKLEVMKSIDLTQINDFEKTTIIETYKFMAFQMGQTLALLQDNVELFTKNAVAQYYPQLKDYLDRKEAGAQNLQDFYQKFTDFVQNSYENSKHHKNIITHFHGIKEVLDVKKEQTLPPVVVFDIDGTLTNEAHRSHLRNEKRWEEYFALCHLDTPIQPIIDLTHEYRAKGYEIWIMSGRAISTEAITRELFEKFNVTYDNIKLRGEGNFIPDFALKPAWISKYIGNERVEVIYDDQDKVIEGFRKKGLNVVDVKPIIAGLSTGLEMNQNNKIKP